MALLCSSLRLPAGAQTQPVPVLVVGGTPAGVAAAISAARSGADVTLVARRPQLGGVLTDAMMDQWDLNLAPDGRAIQGGLFREIHAQLGDVFSPADAARVFGRLVAEQPRIRVITGAAPLAVTSADTANGRAVSRVAFSGPRGPFALDAATVVDATDDGDVAALAGARYDVGRQDTGVDERMQPVTLMFTLRDVDWERVLRTYRPAAYGKGGAVDQRAWGYAALMRAYRPLAANVLVPDCNFGHMSDGEVTVNAIDVLGVDARYDGERLAARTVSEREAPHLLEFLRARVPGFEHAEIGRYASALYVRETRHFAGVERLTATDVWDGTVPDDTIGLSSYPLDLHPVTANERLAYAPERHVYGIPFGTLVPRDLANVVLASPAISATHIASGSARVIPTTIEEGEAAGIAAALSVREHEPIAELAREPDAIAAIRAELVRGGTILTSPSPLRNSARA